MLMTSGMTYVMWSSRQNSYSLLYFCTDLLYLCDVSSCNWAQRLACWRVRKDSAHVKFNWHNFKDLQRRQVCIFFISKQIFHVKSVGRFMIYNDTKFHIRLSVGPMVIAVKLKAKWIFRKAAKLLCLRTMAFIKTIISYHIISWLFNDVASTACYTVSNETGR
jgi:hypothetical protein